MMIVFLIVIYAMHPVLFYFAAGSALLLFSFAVFNHLWSVSAQDKAMKSSGKAQGVLVSGLRNIDVIHAMGMRDAFFRRWEKTHDGSLWWETLSREKVGAVTSVTKSLRLLLQSAMLALGAWLVLDGELNAGGMIVGSILLGRALQPVEQSIMLWKGYQQYSLARKRLEKLLGAHLKTARQEPETAPEVKAAGHLQVRELYAAAPGQPRPWLYNINFDLSPGQALLVTGANGSGKSMLAKVLAGIWHPMNGGVFIDGADLRAWPREKLGELTGYVPQDSQILDGTVAENIARLGPLEEESIQIAASQARAHHAIKAFGGYDADVGPGGKRLPGGLKQRIALARALHGKPKLLILDEPEASLDDDGRKQLIEAIADMKQRGQTVVLITHDPAFQNLADLRLELEEGRVKNLEAVRRPQWSMRL